jgi:hypothetical protein
MSEELSYIEARCDCGRRLTGDGTTRQRAAKAIEEQGWLLLAGPSEEIGEDYAMHEAAICRSCVATAPAQ